MKQGNYPEKRNIFLKMLVESFAEIAEQDGPFDPTDHNHDHVAIFIKKILGEGGLALALEARGSKNWDAVFDHNTFQQNRSAYNLAIKLNNVSGISAPEMRDYANLSGREVLLTAAVSKFNSYERGDILIYVQKWYEIVALKPFPVTESLMEFGNIL